LKPGERITKPMAEESLPSPARAGRRTPFRLLAALLLAAAGGASYYAWLNRPTSEAEITAIEKLIVDGRIDAARERMVGAQVRSKDVAALRLRVGRAYLREGHVGPATPLLAQVEPSLIKEERLAVAEYFLVAGDPFSAVLFFEAAMRTGQPRTAPLLGRYGEALSLSGNGEDAVAAFRESLAKDDSKARVRMNLAITLANLNRFAESRVETLAVLKSEPQNVKALQLLAALPTSP
jgi:Tfp pilus assembly protein PilF